ncbi:MAG: HAD-IA family hydrolase [Clostridia bacterium]
MYQLLLADADGTLFDFDQGEHNAITETFTRFGFALTQENRAIYHRVNDAQWKRLERGETTQERLRVERFSDFLREAGLTGDAQALCDCFVEALSRQRIPMPGAKAFCERVSARMPIVLVTNGIASVQRGRFTDCELTPYLSHLVISEEVGFAKPHPAMVYAAMRLAGISDPSRVVLLGDSPTADIGAACNAGVDSILLSTTQPHCNATYVARTLEEAAMLIVGDTEDAGSRAGDFPPHR